MDKTNKVFLDSFVLGIACGAQRCLELLSHSGAGRNNDSSNKVPGDLQYFLKIIAEVLNDFGGKLQDEANIQSSLFRSILEINVNSPETKASEPGIAQQMSVIFEELVQKFRQLLCNRSEIKLQPVDSSTHAKPPEKTSSITDMSKELCQVLQEMGEILTEIVDSVRADESTIHPHEKTDLKTGSISSDTGDDTLTKTLEDDAKDRTDDAVIVRSDNNDDTPEGNYGKEEHKNEEGVADKDDEETWSDYDESPRNVDHEEIERKIVGPLLEGGISEQHVCIKSTGEEDTADEATTTMEYNTYVAAEDEEVSKEKELLELSAVRMFREHMESDGLDIEIFRTPSDQPTKLPSYTCRLLEMEAVACGRSKKAAKRKALCKMIHLLVKKHEDGCLPKEISPFTNAELWALEDVCLGGDDYLSQLRHLCDSENAPPPVFDVQLTKDSLGEKAFIVKCSALGRSAVGSSSRKRSAKRHAAREIVKQYQLEASAAAAEPETNAK